MEIATMGKVVVRARIVNLDDWRASRKKKLKPGKIRSIDETAVVDTGTTFLSLPKRFIKKLGLEYLRTREAQTATGTVPVDMYEAVLLTVQGRECIVEVTELPDSCPILIGVLALEALDFVVDPVHQKLVGNPDHGGKQMIDLF